MLRTLLVGFGRAGAGLHWQVLRQLRGSDEAAGLFATEPSVVFDTGDARARATRDGLTVVDSLSQAARILDPATTVVHLCVPPAARLAALTEVAALGFTRLLAEKPLASDVDALRGIAQVCRDYSLQLVPVAQWLRSALTLRLRELIDTGELGRLRTINIVQRKSRLSRTLLDAGHPTAFDVELPHSVGLVLGLAGDASVTDAAWADMHVGDVVIPRMGMARLRLDHHSGPVTEIFSELTSPVRERRIDLTFDEGRVIGHYPNSEADHYAHLVVTAGARRNASVLFDDSLRAFFLDTYRRFAAGDDLREDLSLGRRVVEVLHEAKRIAGRVEQGAAGATHPTDASVRTGSADRTATASGMANTVGMLNSAGMAGTPLLAERTAGYVR
ncbi:MAG TPA: hypothetical protein VFX60_18535 [Micromonospora sp.]|nr:hypothetical protein [Micromonospora sp.]